MKQRILIVLFAIIICIWVTPVWGEEITGVSVEPDYIIGHGDVLVISIWKDVELNKQVTVLPDGKIAYPLIGQVIANGKTIAQLKSEIEKKISRYIPDPDLNVAVVQVNSMVIYVIGKVNRMGQFSLKSNIDVMQALAMAGGLSVFAKKNKIKIFRKVGDKTRVYDFQYSKVSKGEHLEMNIQLQRGDMIVVP